MSGQVAGSLTCRVVAKFWLGHKDELNGTPDD